MQYNNFLKIKTEKQLRELLEEYNVRIKNDGWTHPYKKNLRTFIKEILPSKTWGNPRDSFLSEKDGYLTRHVFVAAGRIVYHDKDSDTWLELVQENTMLKNGEELQPNKNVLSPSFSEKFDPFRGRSLLGMLRLYFRGKDLLLVNKRALREELGITKIIPARNFIFTGKMETKINDTPWTYPGIRCEKYLYYSLIKFTKRVYNPNGYQETTPSGTTYYTWRECAEPDFPKQTRAEKVQNRFIK